MRPEKRLREESDFAAPSQQPRKYRFQKSLDDFD
jgi:hypothetical protein